MENPGNRADKLIERILGEAEADASAARGKAEEDPPPPPQAPPPRGPPAPQPISLLPAFLRLFRLPLQNPNKY